MQCQHKDEVQIVESHALYSEKTEHPLFVEQIILLESECEKEDIVREKEDMKIKVTKSI